MVSPLVSPGRFLQRPGVGVAFGVVKAPAGLEQRAQGRGPALQVRQPARDPPRGVDDVKALRFQHRSRVIDVGVHKAGAVRQPGALGELAGVGYGMLGEVQPDSVVGLPGDTECIQPEVTLAVQHPCAAEVTHLALIDDAACILARQKALDVVPVVGVVVVELGKLVPAGVVNGEKVDIGGILKRMGSCSAAGEVAGDLAPVYRGQYRLIGRTERLRAWAA